jgi:hypothetical protein
VKENVTYLFITLKFFYFITTYTCDLPGFFSGRGMETDILLPKLRLFKNILLLIVLWDSGENIFKIFSIFVNYIWYTYTSPFTVAARSKAWTVFVRSNTGIVGSNHTWGIDDCVRLFCVCAVPCAGSGLATGWSPSKEFYRLRKRSRNWKGGQRPTKSSRAIDR